MRSGFLLVLEGPEGAGKSTQASRLAQHLTERGIRCSPHREPGGTAVGERVRAILLDSASHLSAESECLLFLASRAELVREVVQPALRRGEVVILDRFFLSTYAYQVHGRGLNEELVREANALATGGVVPELTLLLQVDPAVAWERVSGRGGQDRMELAGDDFHTRVAAAFREFATDEWQRAHPECGLIQTVNASLSENEVFAQIVGLLQKRQELSGV